uniref:Bm12945 n=1 Tax=Brugia malayi TaxID=6279 RepID=A0A1I9G6B8_BRUMA|nr:Bm12945 [Brugia malayi]
MRKQRTEKRGATRVGGDADVFTSERVPRIIKRQLVRFE